MKAIIVGAGLAGCAAAWALEQHGYECTLLEASEKAGGRMRSTTIGQHNVDVGFHVLHTAYPSLKRWLNLEELELEPMEAATDLIASGAFAGHSKSLLKIWSVTGWMVLVMGRQWS